MTGASSRPEVEHGRATRATGRVLVVDDDAALAEMLTIVLRNEGFDSPGRARGRPGAGGRSATTGPTWCCST